MFARSKESVGRNAEVTEWILLLEQPRMLFGIC